MSALAEAVKHCSLTSLREKLVTIGARLAGHGRYVMFQRAEVKVPVTCSRKFFRSSRN
jgi:hypothetical protein